MTSSLALWWYSLPKQGCEPIPLTGLHSYEEKQSVFVHELNSRAPFRGRKLHYTCTFSTHYRVTTDLAKMTEKRLKWTPRRPFSSARPGWTHCNNYVKMYLRQLGRNIKHSVFIRQLGSLEVVKFNRISLESRKCALLRLGDGRRVAAPGYQTTSVPVIWCIQAFPWSSTITSNDLHWISVAFPLVSPREFSFSLTSDKQQEEADVGKGFLKTFSRGSELQTAAEADRRHPPSHLL